MCFLRTVIESLTKSRSAVVCKRLCHIDIFVFNGRLKEFHLNVARSISQIRIEYKSVSEGQ